MSVDIQQEFTRPDAGSISNGVIAFAKGQSWEPIDTICKPRPKIPDCGMICRLAVRVDEVRSPPGCDFPFLCPSIPEPCQGLTMTHRPLGGSRPPVPRAF